MFFVEKYQYLPPSAGTFRPHYQIRFLWQCFKFSKIQAEDHR